MSINKVLLASRKIKLHEKHSHKESCKNLKLYMSKAIWIVYEEIIQEAFLPGKHLKSYIYIAHCIAILFIIIISVDGKTAFGKKY